MNRRMLVAVMVALVAATAAMAGSFGAIKARHLAKPVEAPQRVGHPVTEPQPGDLNLMQEHVYDCANGHCVIGHDADRDCANPALTCEAGSSIMHLRVTYAPDVDVVGFQLLDETAQFPGSKEACDVWMSRATFLQVIQDLNLP